MSLSVIPRIARNFVLLLGSAGRHLTEDPALLVLQVTRRLPMGARIRTGRALQAIDSFGPRFAGPASLGAFMAGDEDGAWDLASRGVGVGSRLAGEVAVLLSRCETVAETMSPQLLARAALERGDVSGAIRELERADRSGSRLARTLRSELHLMTPGTRLRVPLRGEDVRFGAPTTENERLRVLHLITNSLPHTQSGYSLRTHRVLTSLRGAGVDSIALTRPGYPVMIGKVCARDEDVVDGVVYRRSLPARLGDSPERRLSQEVATALSLVREFRPHVLHATTDYRNALVAEAVSEATGVPWILEVRGLMEQTWIASRRTPQGREIAARSQKAELVAAQEGAVARRARAVITLSSTMGEELTSRDVPPEKITLVPNGVDVDLLSQSLCPDSARDKIGINLPGDAFVVGAVSALVGYEGHEVLLRAVARILSDRRVPESLRARLHVLLAGDGVSAPALDALAVELGIRDRVRMPGRVPRSDAAWWVQAMDVVVVPRLDLEVTRSVTPQKPVEAMALGRPVVISDLPALRESATDGEGRLHAEIFDAGDAHQLADVLVELAMDPGRRESLADGGRSLAAERSWPAMMRLYVSVYRKAITDATED